jgi:hypothetical protein
LGLLTQRWSIAVLSTIRPVTLDDVVGLGRYEAIRDEFRAHIIALKRHRRLAVGEEITFVFENHATVLFQIQEMLRAERITDLDSVREEIEVYNASLPLPGQLSATLLIAITTQDRIAERLQSLIGIDQAVRKLGRDPGVVRGGMGERFERELSAQPIVEPTFGVERREDVAVSRR